MFRVSKSTFYRTSTEMILRNRYEQLAINERITANKDVLKPSDNVVASSINQGSHRVLNELDQYSYNIGNNKTWLQQGSSSMQQLSTLLTEIKEKAEQMATGTYTPEQRQTISGFARQIFEQIVNMMNVQVDNKYIFAGTRNDSQAASLNILSETPATIVDANGGSGRLYGQGVYTGLYSREVELTVVSAPPVTDPPTPISADPIIGEPLVLQYSYYDDYGRKKEGQVTLTGTGTGHGVDIGDGLQIYADPRTTFVEGGKFVLEAGRHRGNNEEIYGNLSWGSQQQYNYLLDQLLGAEAFSGMKAMLAVASARNYSLSTGSLAVGGEDAVLKQFGMDFTVGGPFQSTQGNQALLSDRNYQFTVVSMAFPGQPPSATNPMVVSYTYEDPPGTVITPLQPLTITGSGPENTVLLEPPGEGSGLYVLNAAYNVGDTFSFLPYSNGSTPSVSNPLPLTYTYTDPFTGQRAYHSIAVTKPGSKLILNPPGQGVSVTVGSGTFNAGDSWKIEEGLLNGGYHNLLDLITGWQDALDKDNTVQKHFAAMPGVNNQVTSKGGMNVSGDWEELKKRGYEFYVGNAAQTSQTDRQKLIDRNYEFNIDPGFAGGTPSPSNPMVINYSYVDDLLNPQTGSITITGTGPDYAVNLEPPGEGTNFYLPNAEYAYDPLAPLPHFTFDTTYDSSLAPSSTNPMTITYTYKDDEGVRHYDSVTITDMGSTRSLEPATLDENGLPVYSVSLSFASGSRFASGDSFNLTLEQYNQGQTYSQNLLTEITNVQTNLLKYTGDAGAKLNNIEVRLTFMGDDVIRLDDRLKQLEDVDLAVAATTYTQLEVMYRAALMSINGLFSVSLADYL